MAGVGKSAVFLALVGNAFLTVTKFVAFILSGSGAMMSEAVHSFADTANQGLLFLGIRRSLRPADERYHEGYGAERYVFALLSASGIFFLGCGVTVYHGIHSLLHPPDLSLSWITFAVLGISIIVDGWVCLQAVREVNETRRGQPFLQFIRTTTDPTLVAVLFEDFVALGGAVIALVGIALAQLTGNPTFDAASSILIGTMLGMLALWLGWRNRELILGPAIPREVTDQVIGYLEEQPSVNAVRALKSRVVAADQYRIAAEVHYDGDHLGKVHGEWVRERLASLRPEESEAFAAEFGRRIIESLGDEVDRMEKELVEKIPQLQHLEFEVD
jgi:zinc transporter 9